MRTNTLALSARGQNGRSFCHPPKRVPDGSKCTRRRNCPASATRCPRPTPYPSSQKFASLSEYSKDYLSHVPCQHPPTQGSHSSIKLRTLTRSTRQQCSDQQPGLRCLSHPVASAHPALSAVLASVSLDSYPAPPLQPDWTRSQVLQRTLELQLWTPARAKSGRRRMKPSLISSPAVWSSALALDYVARQRPLLRLLREIQRSRISRVCRIMQETESTASVSPFGR